MDQVGLGSRSAMVRKWETYRDTKFIRNASPFLWACNLAGVEIQSQLANAYSRWRHSA